MPNPIHHTEPSDVVGTRVREIRNRQGLTVEALAQRCTSSGLPHLTPNALYLIEGGGRGKSGTRSRRRVTVEELLGLSVALGVPPLALLLPEDAADEFAVTPEVAASAEDAFQWAIGTRAQPADVLSEKLASNQLGADPAALLPGYMRDRGGADSVRLAADRAHRAIADLARAAANQHMINRDAAGKAEPPRTDRSHPTEEKEN
jgi:transcriptional regulator with XRE-family HTH domain